jgi:NAD-dependent deacetylase
VNIHGTDSEVVCVACGARDSREAAQRAWEAGESVPRCSCGGAWKPATISFGQRLVEDDLSRAFSAASACDLFVAAGTSLVVGPVNSMFELADRGGAFTAILTASETPFDERACLRSAAPVEELLPAVFRAAELEGS